MIQELQDELKTRSEFQRKNNVWKSEREYKIWEDGLRQGANLAIKHLSNQQPKELAAEIFDALETIEADLMKSNLFDHLTFDMPSPDYMLRLHDATAKFRSLFNSAKPHPDAPESNDKI